MCKQSSYDSCHKIHLGRGRGDRHVAVKSESAPRLEYLTVNARIIQNYPDHSKGGMATIKAYLDEAIRVGIFSRFLVVGDKSRDGLRRVRKTADSKWWFTSGTVL